MHWSGIKEGLLSIYLVFLLITLGFVNILVLEGIIDTGSVEGAKIIIVDCAGGGQYLTIQAGIDNAKDGDTIIVANGTYSESVTIYKSNITLIGNSTTKCKIKHHYTGKSASDFAAAINVTASKVTITGFNIAVSGDYTYGIRLASALASDSIIKNNKIQTSGRYGYGIMVYLSSNGNIEFNTINTTDRSAYGIYLSRASNNNISFNTITNTGQYGHGIYLQGASDNILANNTIKTHGSVSNGFYSSQNSNYNKFTDNTIYTNTEWSHAFLFMQASNIKITANTINTYEQNAHGIYVMFSTIYFNISNNRIQTPGRGSYGIFTQSSTYFDIINNTIINTGKNGYGFYLAFSSNFNIIENRVETTNEGYGFYLYTSQRLTLSENIMTNCSIVISGNSKEHWNTHTIDTLNLVNNKPVYYYKDASSKTVPAGAGQVIFANCKYMSVSNQSFNYSCVYLGYTDYSMVKNITFNNCNLQLISSTNNELIGNTVVNPKQYLNGIFLLSKSNSNKIHFNTLNTYKQYGYGIYSVDQTHKNDISNNTINTFNIDAHGINLQASEGNNLANNSISTSKRNSHGISIIDAGGNYVIGNNISTVGEGAFCVLIGSNYNVVINNTGKTTGVKSPGIRIFNGDNNKLTGNRIRTSGSESYGIQVEYNSDENDLIENKIETTGLYGHGIRVQQSCFNTLINTEIKTSGNRGDGINLEESPDNDIIDNKLTTTNGGYGIYFQKESNNNELMNNTIKTDSATGHGIFIKDSNNNQVKNSTISTKGPNAHGFYLDSLNATVFNTSIFTLSSLNNFGFKATNDGNITAINCTFKSVQVKENGGGTLRVKNYLDIQVYDDDGVTPLSDVDVNVKDNDVPIYASAGYGGTDDPTDSSGRVGSILVMDRWYDHDNTAIDNFTTVKVKKMFDKLWEVDRPNIDMNTSHTETFYFDLSAPPIPTGLKVTRVPGTNTLNISWDTNLDTVRYEVLTNKTGLWTTFKFINHPKTWTFDEDLEDETWYYYKIQAWDKIDLNSGFSGVVSYFLSDITPPAIPSGLNCKPVPKGDAINISWNVNLNDTVEYKIYWQVPKSDNWLEIETVPHPDNWVIWSNKDLKNGSKYNFKIRAWDNVGLSSPYSAPASVIHRDYLAPSAPKNVHATTISETEIKLSWDTSSEPDVEVYRVFMNKSGAGSGGPFEIQKEVKNLAYEVTGLVENTVYYFAVIAVDEANNTSPYSQETWNTTLANVPPLKPKIISTKPVQNSTEVPIDITVIITFSIPMNTSSVANALSILPTEQYIQTWETNNTVLTMNFPNNLRYATNYTILIKAAKATTGGILEDALFLFKFKTESETSQPPQSQFTIEITNPTANTVFKPGERINISGTSTGLREGTQFTLTFGENRIDSIVDENGNWYIHLDAPETEGDYIITVTVGNTSHSVEIRVTPEIDNKADETKIVDTEFGTLSVLYMGVVTTVFMILLVLVVIFFIIRRKPSTKAMIDDKWDYIEYTDQKDKYYTDTKRDYNKPNHKSNQDIDEEYYEAEELAEGFTDELEPDLIEEDDELEDELEDEYEHEPELEEFDEVEADGDDLAREADDEELAEWDEDGLTVVEETEYDDDWAEQEWIEELE